MMVLECFRVFFFFFFSGSGLTKAKGKNVWVSLWRSSSFLFI